jgi:hypothetical protein
VFVPAGFRIQIRMDKHWKLDPDANKSESTIRIRIRIKIQSSGAFDAKNGGEILSFAILLF